MTSPGRHGSEVGFRPGTEAAAAAPEWFLRALAIQPEEVGLIVQGCRINVLRWGGGPKPPIVFVHGNGAHARWWSFIAPFFAEDRTVAAFDLGGMGDSGARTEYSPESFAAEIAAVVRFLCNGTSNGPAEIVGHSFGGLVSTWFAYGYPDLARRLVLVDTPFLSGETYDPPWRARNTSRRYFRSETEAMRHFRLLPPQICDNAYIIDYVAKHSVKLVDAGWAWKFSSNPWAFPEFQSRFWSRTNRRLQKLKCPVAFIRGEQSALCDTNVSERWRSLRQAAPIINLPAAHHHVPLDQPLALVAALRAIFALLC